MFCSSCGAKLPDGAAFCGECGARVVELAAAPAAPAQAAAPAAAPVEAAPAAAPAPQAAAPAAAPAPAAAAPQAAPAPQPATAAAAAPAPQPAPAPAAAAPQATPQAAPAPQPAPQPTPAPQPAPAVAGDGSSVDLAAVMQKHKMKLAIGGGVLAVLVVVALVLPTGTSTLSSTPTSTSSTTATTNSSASADSDSDSTEAETVQITKATKVALSKALSKKSVWFKGASVKGSSSQLGVAYVFDGKGNMTVYYTTGLTAASLKGKSTDEIIRLVKKADKDWFKQEQQEKIDTYTERIQDNKKAVADIQNGAYNGSEDKYTDRINKEQEIIKQVKALKYKAPTANPFSLHIVTGADGKSTDTETIQYTSFSYNRGIQVDRDEYDEDPAVSFNSTEEAYQLEFSENSTNNVSTFSGMTFRKFGNLTKLLDEGTNEQYVLDKPNAKGVTVDI